MFQQRIPCVVEESDSLLSQVLAQQSSNASRAETLPAETYNSEAFFDLEMRKVLRQDWLFVGHVAQVPEVNDFFTLDVVGEPLLIVRNEAGVRVMSNVCLHRWVPIASGSGNASTFVCPFHNWSYDSHGQLTGAPSMQQAEGFDRHQCQLPEVRHEIVAGMIFVTFAEEIAPLAERLAPLASQFAQYEMSDLHFAYALDYDCPFNWKMAIETFMECYHHAGVHRSTLEDSFPGKLTSIGQDGEGWTVCHQPLRKRGELSEILTEGLLPFASLPEEALRYSDLMLLYPNCLLSLNPDRITISAILPVSATASRWHRIVLVSKAAAAQESFAATAEKMQQGSLVIIAEDQEINQLQQRGSRSQLARPGRLSHLETTVWHFANYLRKRLAV